MRAVQLLKSTAAVIAAAVMPRSGASEGGGTSTPEEHQPVKTVDRGAARRTGRGVRATAVSVTVVALALTACTPATEPNTSTSGDQTLRLSAQAPPSSWAIGNAPGGDATMYLSVYDTLLHTNSDAEITEGVADKWEYNGDLTELTLHIREGQKFTNGEALDADAVVASLNVSRKGPSTATNLTAVTDVKATDESTVVLTLSAPDAALIPNLADVAGAVGAPEVLTAESSTLEPVGSGPYSLDKSSVAGSNYVLKKNPDNWDADSYPFETVKFQIIADPTAITNAMQAGQLDYVGLTSPDQVTQFPSPKFTTGYNNATGLGVLWLADREGTVIPALKDVRVRQAINLALDRESIAAKLQAGSLHPTEQVVNPNGGAWSDELNETYSYNVQEAKALMAEAGYADGFAVTMPSTFLSTAYEPALSQQLGEIGIKVTWETVPFQDFLTKVFSQNYGMYFMFNAFRSADSVDVKGATTAIFNPFNSTSPEFEGLMAKANASQSPDAFDAVNEYFVKEAWFAPIFYTAGPYVVSDKVTYTPAKTFYPSLKMWAPAN
jgi:ABC-type transport system substrate-binding protein